MILVSDTVAGCSVWVGPSAAGMLGSRIGRRTSNVGFAGLFSQTV